MVHALGFDEGAVGFDDDVVLVAEGGDVGAGEEGVDFDLVDGRDGAGVGVKEFLELQGGSFGWGLDLG